VSGECDCREARAWRAYWTAEAIAARLREEVDLYRRICHERWVSVFADSKRPEARIAPSTAESHAVMHERRYGKPLDPP
jgi:hypothetical protein